MGWTTCYYATDWKMDRKGHMSVDRRKECDRICTWERREPETGADGHVYPAMKDTVLKSAMVGRVYYAAIRREVAGRTPYVWAAVFLTCGKSSDGTVWGYKDMCESSQPFYYDCPAGILALLSPTDDENANAWRAECRRTLAEKAAKRKLRNEPLYVPTGVSVEKRQGSWVLSSHNYRLREPKYAGIRYTKARWHDFEACLRDFLGKYGTRQERAEYAATGRECPAGWKGAAA